MPSWGKLESSRYQIAEAFEILSENEGTVRFDGIFTGSGHWVLSWSGVFPPAKPHQLIRTTSFERYAAAVAQAISSRRPLTSRKPSTIASAASNAFPRSKLS